MKILITSGGTTEYIDDVRVLTNISTGKLGALIAHTLAEELMEGESYYQNFTPKRQYEITYVHTRSAALPETTGYEANYLYNIKFREVTDVASLMETMRELVPQHDVIIHAMAVSDFGFRRDKAVKLKSNDPAGFIEYMRANIVPNPKVISYIKHWNSNCKLVGFKFEVGLTTDKLIDVALVSMLNNQCDLVIANDKEEMQREGEHIAYIVSRDAQVGSIIDPENQQKLKVVGKQAKATKLVEYVKSLQKD